MVTRFFERVTERQIIIGLVALTLIVFLPFIGNAFVSLDDNYLIYQNPYVMTLTWSHLVHVFTTYDPQLYIPLTFLSFQLNALVFGMNAWAFHLVNILLQCGNVVLVFVILRKLTRNLFVAVLAAALFAVHPIQTEAVLWASSRKDLLSGLFFLLSTYSYLRHREDGNGSKNLYLSILFYVLGLLSKVSVIMLPLWLLGIDWMQRRPMEKNVILEKLPYGVAAVLFGLIAIVGKSRVLQSSGTALNVLLPVKSVVFYLQKFILPVGLSVIYPYTPSGHLLLEFGVDAAVIVALLGLIGWLAMRGKNRALPFFLGTYLLLLVPSFTTFWKNGFLYFASDRYVYLASIGIFAAVAWVIHSVFLSKKTREQAFVPAAVISGILLLIFIPVTMLQAAVWTGTESLYRNVIRFYPDSVMAQTNLGLELQRNGNGVEARDHYMKALAADPHAIQAYFDLASLEVEEKHDDAAVKLYIQVVDAFGLQQVTSVADIKPLLWLATELRRLGKAPDGERLLLRLVTLAPQYPEAHQALGEWYRDDGKDALALREFEAAAKSGTSDPHTYYYLVEYYSGSGRTLDVINALKKGVALDPDNIAAKQKLQELLRTAQ